MPIKKITKKAPVKKVPAKKAVIKPWSPPKPKAPVPSKLLKGLIDAAMCPADVLLALGSPADGLIDVGTGLSGAVGVEAWGHTSTNLHVIDTGEIKEHPPVWTVHTCDALLMLNEFGPDSVDVVQAARFIECLDSQQVATFLDVAMAVSRKWVFIVSRLDTVLSAGLDVLGFDISPWRTNQAIAVWKK